VVLFNGSLVWQVLILRHKAGNTGGRTVLSSFARTGLAALLGGATAWIVVQIAPSAVVQLFVGAGLGLMVYALALLMLRSSEAQMILTIVAERISMVGRKASTM